MGHLGEKVDPKLCTVQVTFILEDPDIADNHEASQTLMGAPGQHLLDVAMCNDINIEHACGGVCACSTCHIYIEQGKNDVTEATEAEEDRVEEAPGLQINSRLSCQCELKGEGPITVRVPAWNRNAVKEVPH